jgi:hypothetical protein
MITIARTRTDLQYGVIGGVDTHRVAHTAVAGWSCVVARLVDVERDCRAWRHGGWVWVGEGGD